MKFPKSFRPEKNLDKKINKLIESSTIFSKPTPQEELYYVFYNSFEKCFIEKQKLGINLMPIITDTNSTSRHPNIANSVTAVLAHMAVNLKDYTYNFQRWNTTDMFDEMKMMDFLDCYDRSLRDDFEIHIVYTKPLLLYSKSQEHKKIRDALNNCRVIQI